MYLTIRLFVCNQYPVMYPSCFIIVCNVNSVNAPSVHSLIPQHFCVLETPSWLISYKFQLFSLKEVHLRSCVAEFFVFWPDELCVWLCCLQAILADCFGPAHASSYRPTMCYLWFSSELVLSYYFVLYCIPAYSLSLPIFNYHRCILFALWSTHLTYLPFTDTWQFCMVSFSN